MRRHPADVPGDPGWPLLGHSVAFAADAAGLMHRRRGRYGDVFRTRVQGADAVMFSTPDAARTIFLDRDDVLSSELGWSYSIGPMFARGLMLRDFGEHRAHRAVMKQAFRRAALEGYLPIIRGVVERHVEALTAHDVVDVHPFIKRMTLDVAAEVFLGHDLDERAEHLNRAFSEALLAGVTPIRADVPGTRFHRGLRARRRMQRFFAEEVARRRAAPEASDLLSRLCHATGDDGRPLSDGDVVDHMIFLLMAAHDTTTASLTVMLAEIARRPDWHDRLTAEVDALGGAAVDLTTERTMSATDLVFREATRLHPPVPFSPRVLLAPRAIDGWWLPAGTPVVVATLLLHRHPEWWSRPDTFDPERFASGRDEHRAHSHLFVPFGGGAHTCLGNHFSRLVVTTVVATLLRRVRVHTDPDEPFAMRAVPVPRPRRPVRLSLRHRRPVGAIA